MKTKQDLINQVYAINEVSKGYVERVINDFVAALRAEIVAGNEVRIKDFGTFRPVIRPAHTGRNPRTGEAVEIPERRIPQLKFSSSVRRDLNAE